MRTIKTKTMGDTTVDTREESTPVATVGNYEPVRFNVMKQGIFSRLAVLAHEDHAEFDDLLAALIDEHRPAGMTERHLVEELATIIWRKRRVLMAEGAKINEGLRSAVDSASSVIKSAAPFQRGVGDAHTDLRDLLDGTPEEILERQQDTALDLAATRKAAAILRKGGTNAYVKARQALIQDSRDWWDEHVREDQSPANAEDPNSVCWAGDSFRRVICSPQLDLAIHSIVHSHNGFGFAQEGDDRLAVAAIVSQLDQDNVVDIDLRRER